MTITRRFAASRSRVWAAWTTPELFEKWWAPKPWKAIVKTFDFREGGQCHYYMEGPDGEKQWCLLSYESIDPENSFSLFDGFADEAGNMTDALPSMHWRNEFKDEGETTLVVVTIQFQKLEDIQKIIEMGFKEGFTMGLGNLDEVLLA
ncbi:MAG: SRPBCC domain-containing protein [Candidatus Gracilibacteria bacterium]